MSMSIPQTPEEWEKYEKMCEEYERVYNEDRSFNEKCVVCYA